MRLFQISLFFLLCTTTALADDYKTLISKKDGSTLAIKCEDIDSIHFTNEQIPQDWFYGSDTVTVHDTIYVNDNQDDHDVLSIIKFNYDKSEPDAWRGDFYSWGYVDYTTGDFIKKNDARRNTRTDYIEIPPKTDRIVHNFRSLSDYEEFDNSTITNAVNPGWAIYDENKKFIMGGISNIIDIEPNCKYIVLSDIKYNAIHTGRTLIFQSGRKNLKTIGFSGDSVTFGYDDNNNGEQLQNPWVDQVATLLDIPTINYGISSASLIYQPETKQSVLRTYKKYDDNIDVLCVMIGINDAYRGYDLGGVNDRCDKTFYGALHNLWSGLVEKYPISKEKRLICLIYPYYDNLPSGNWKAWTDAMKEVAEFYSVPICDLSAILPISAKNDTEYKYWKKQGNGHSAHPNQLASNYIANAISYWIKDYLKSLKD